MILDSIKLLLSLGFAVFPCTGKQPATRHGFKDASKEMDQCVKWWTQSPSSNVAVATGEVSGIVVLDIDGADGFHALKVNGYEIPETLTVETARGKHYYFKHPGFKVGNRAGLLPKVDVRGDGGYVIAPPSVHPDTGALYEFDVAEGINLEFLHKEECLIEPMPQWLIDLFQSVKSQHVEKTNNTDDIPEGQRNDVLFRMACKWRGLGLSRDQIFNLIGMENANRCKPPLSKAEIKKISDSAATYDVDGLDVDTAPDFMAVSSQLSGIVSDKEIASLKEKFEKGSEAKAEAAKASGIVVELVRRASKTGGTVRFDATIHYAGSVAVLRNATANDLLSWPKAQALCFSQKMVMHNTKKTRTAYRRAVEAAVSSVPDELMLPEEDIPAAVSEFVAEWIEAKSVVGSLDEMLLQPYRRILSVKREGDGVDGLVFAPNALRNELRDKMRVATNSDIGEAYRMMGITLIRKTDETGVRRSLRVVWSDRCFISGGAVRIFKAHK